MPVPSHVIGVKGDECQCGRRATIRHCPSCGSTRIYGRSNRLHKYFDGHEAFVATEFRCQSCTHLFIEEERILCEAPPIGPKLALQKVRSIAGAKLSGEQLSPTELKLAKAMDVVAGTKLGEEPRLTEKEVDYMLRQAWHDQVFASLSDKKDKPSHPGPCDEYVAKHMRDFLPNWTPKPKTEEEQVHE